MPAIAEPLVAPQILGQAEGIIAAEVGPVCVVIWRGAVNEQRFELQRQCLARVVARHPGRAAFACVIEPTAEPPNDELRRASVEMVAAHEKRLKCIACVIEGTGFRAAVARCVLSGMALIAPRKVPVAAFASVWPAARWMSELMPIPSVEQFTLSVESVRSRLA